MKFSLIPRQVKHRLFWGFISLAVIPLCFAGIILSWQNQKDYLTNAYVGQKNHAHHLAKDIYLSLTSIEREMQQLERFTGIMSLEKEEQEDLLWNLLTYRKIFQEIHLLDSHGEELLHLSTKTLKPQNNQREGQHDYQKLNLPLKSKKTFYGPVQFNQSSGMPWMYIAIPLFNYQTGQVSGVLATKINWKYIWEMLSGNEIEEGENIYIINTANQVIAHSNPTIVLRGTQFDPVFNDKPQPGLHGESSIIAIASTQLGEEKFMVIIEQSVAVALQPVKKSIIFICLILLAALLCSLLLAHLTIRQVFIPLEKLMIATRELIAGNYGQQLKIPSGGEMASLVIAFNQMSSNLRETLDSLTQEIYDRQEAQYALRKSEERFRALIENTSDWIWEVDAQFHYTYSSPRIRELLGYEPQELLGTTPFDLMPQEEQQHIEKHLKQIIENREPIHGLENINIHKDGSTVILETSAMPIIDETGTFLGYRGIDRNISERKKNDDEKIKLEARLSQAQKMEAIGTLAGGITHDFNNILSPILGYTEMALETIPADSQTAEDLKGVLKAANRAKELVKQILAFSRQNKQELQPLEIQLVTKEALKLLRSSIPTTIEIKQNIDPECGAVLVDPTQIHQIIMNLCTNAYHAMRETGGVLGVALTPVELGSDNLTTKIDLTAGLYVQLEVSDSGFGMDQIVLERIFDPYYTTKAQGEGTGLGLSVVLGIVKDLHGDITVYSEPGHGTTFRVYFPVVETETVKGVDAKIAARLPSGNEHVLVVDDEEAIVNLEQKMLSSLGYQVSCFTNCEEALKAFRTQPDTFDLIITDMTMPKINGLQLTREVLALRSDIPVIMCTGFSELINEKKAKDAGISRYLMKPLLKKDLAITVRDVLDQKKS